MCTSRTGTMYKYIQGIRTKNMALLQGMGCTRAYGLGSQCRPNECIVGSGKPWGVGISGRGLYEPGEGMGKLVYEQPGNEVDGSCHSKEGSK